MGIVPAAGRGTRVSPLPCSKEVYPVGFRTAEDGSPRPRVAVSYLLEKMVRGGASRAVIVLRRGKWDIPAYLGQGRGTGLDLAYVLMRRPYGVPFSVDDAHAFVRDATVLFGFPDIVSHPDDMFGRLLARLRSADADVAVAVYPRRPSGEADGIELGADGTIGAWATGPGGSHPHTWIAAAWTPAFTGFLHDFLEGEREATTTDELRPEESEMSMRDAILEAMAAGLRVEPVRFDDGSYVDIGTPEDLAEAVRDFASRSVGP